LDVSLGNNSKKEVVRTGGLSPTTLKEETLGLPRIVVNGVVSVATAPSKCYFRYGSASTSLAYTTVTRQTSLGRFGGAEETRSNLFRRINSFGLTMKFIENEEGIIEGNVIEFSRPKSFSRKFSKPVIISREERRAKVRFCANAIVAWGILSGSVNVPRGKS
jgi:hypothetical protein